MCIKSMPCIPRGSEGKRLNDDIDMDDRIGLIVGRKRERRPVEEGSVGIGINEDLWLADDIIIIIIGVDRSGAVDDTGREGDLSS